MKQSNKDHTCIILNRVANTGCSKYLKYGILNLLSESGLNFEIKDYQFPEKKHLLKYLLLLTIKFNLIYFLSLISKFLKILFTFLFFDNTSSSLCSHLLKLKIFTISAGDCIMSDYFRSPTTGYNPKYSFLNIIYFLKRIFFYYLIYFQFQNFYKKENNLILFSYETTGVDEYFRRLCLSCDCIEIRFSPFEGGYRFFQNYNGVSLRKFSKLRSYHYSKFSNNELLIGQKKIKSLVNRHDSYSYMKNFDIDTKLEIGINPLPTKSTVIIFLSTLSDAQYLYGVGPFSSLPEFHERLIEISLSKGYNVVVKPHPSMLKEQDYSVKDRNYYSDLLKKYKSKPLTSNISQSQSINKLYFLNEFISVKQISKIFPAFMCVTNHGSVAAECSYLNHFCLVSSNSQYIRDDLFVFIIRNKKDVDTAFTNWQKHELYNKEETNSIYKYIYLNNVSCRNQTGDIIFEGLCPENHDSSFIDKWIFEFEKNTGGKNQLMDHVTKYINSLDNDTITISDYHVTNSLPLDQWISDCTSNINV